MSTTIDILSKVGLTSIGMCSTLWINPDGSFRAGLFRYRSLLHLVVFLEGFLGDDEEVANLKLRGTEYWLRDTVFKQYNGNNETKFTALPGGRYTVDSFEGIGANAFFWGYEILPTQKKSSYTHIYYMDGEFNKRYCEYNYFLSVRCIGVK